MCVLFRVSSVQNMKAAPRRACGEVRAGQGSEGHNARALATHVNLVSLVARQLRQKQNQTKQNRAKWDEAVHLTVNTCVKERKQSAIIVAVACVLSIHTMQYGNSHSVLRVCTGEPA